jgi:hypothetical protein
MSQPITKANPRTIQSGPLAGRTFTTERAYRAALRGVAGKQQVAPATSTLDKFYGVVKRVAQGESLTRAVKSEGTTLETIKKINQRHDVLAQPKLFGRSKRYSIDNSFAHLPILEPNNQFHIQVPLDRVNASIVGNYWNDVKSALAGKGNINAYANMTVRDLFGKSYKLETNLTQLDVFLYQSDDSVDSIANMYERKAVVFR